MLFTVIYMACVSCYMGYLKQALTPTARLCGPLRCTVRPALYPARVQYASALCIRLTSTPYIITHSARRGVVPWLYMIRHNRYNIAHGTHRQAVIRSRANGRTGTEAPTGIRLDQAKSGQMLHNVKCQQHPSLYLSVLTPPPALRRRIPHPGRQRAHSHRQPASLRATRIRSTLTQAVASGAVTAMCRA